MRYGHLNEIPLASRIKDIKNRKNLTNQELADLSGVTLSNISKLLAGYTKYPAVDTVAKVASALDVSIDYLVYGEEVFCNMEIPLNGYRVIITKDKEK